MKIAIYCVAYKSYHEANQYLASIEEAMHMTTREVCVNIFLADNTDQNPQEFEYTAQLTQVRIFAFHKNLGYLGAIRQMMIEVSPLAYDFSIISNVDMRFRKETIEALLQTHITPDIGWIAPATISISTGNDLNPQSIKRYSLKKLKIMRFIYKHPSLYNLYVKTIFKQKSRLTHSAGPVYAGHGSCIILTKTFFTKCGIIDYPVFLYSEEIYLAEECQRHNLSVIYTPSIIIDDIGMVSTGLAAKKQYCHWCREGIDYIISTYY